MAQINKPTDHFNTVLYTGNTNDNHSITGVGFEPDFTWIKSRTGTAFDHRNFDIVRGAGKRIGTNKTDAEATVTNELKSFDTDGFTLGTSVAVNGSANFASWNWKAGGTAVSNTDGSITSSVSANTDSGFSIVSYTGNNTAGATVGHGLGVEPSMYIIKNRDNASESFFVYHKSLGNTKGLYLNSSGASTTNTVFTNNTSPTSSVFSVGAWTGNNGSGNGLIAYCFADVKGFSRMGSYQGNTSVDGTFLYLGFKPAFLLVKGTTTAESWIMFDNARSPSNAVDKRLLANANNSETSDLVVDFLSNGVKFRSDQNAIDHANTYIYMAFAEQPLVGDNPATAR